ncbi:bifunctional ADP-dependent NAD(P)H-hydrate dehydratase/NAD(P)H-hydrate epimerase [Legionella saoudiensis]|uniref:bifunctional ADP-dependent NAD(P)H-hydrate dehydratase/NAD(P)H-hydrate epimerase n=1 Tax=Legionella saoudiensis TaxID=1750561 RepID=UPI000731841C|nr:bifunctional ADP-dependent NAD(P)H-hydrate dehydratase/NAD(P)H-hydrate epimerase [Legionella saoudiensis]
MIKPENALYRCEHIRACEQQATSLYHLDENELMARAGAEAFAYIQKLYPQVKHLAVFCGSGNNAGDGYVVARLAHEYGLTVTIYQAKALADLPHAAQYAALMAIDAGVECQPVDEPLDSEVELIVDALLGIGLQGPVHGLIASAINQINDSGIPVVSLDIPSGLNANTGCVENLCVKAATTLTFIALKAGLYTADAPDYCGDIYCCPIQLEACLVKQPLAASLLGPTNIGLPLMPRKKNSHKGDYGHVLVIGGGPGMPGAISLAAKAAMRTGAGSVSIATIPEHAKGALALIPEAMVWGISSASELQPLLARASVCVIGPGLGDSDWAVSLFLAAITSQLPMVIDASALRLLAEHPQLDDNWILTPHPGEAAALLSCSTAQVQQDRYQAAANIQKQYGGVVVLKGAGSIIQAPEQKTFVCPKGNPAMASAGMGDVLSGIIAGLCAQGLSLSEAARCGVYAHALAGDKVAYAQGGVGLLASDLFDVLPYVLNYCE